MHRTVASIVVMALWLSPSAIAQTKNTASTNKVKSFDHLVINVSDMERALAHRRSCRRESPRRRALAAETRPWPPPTPTVETFHETTAGRDLQLKLSTKQL